MTISTTTIKNSYSGDNSTTAFTYTFKITDQDDIDVIIRSADGSETTKTITTHYTVAGVGNAGGGTINFTTGNVPTNTETVVLRRSTPQTQGVDLIENDPLPADTLEDALDKLTSINQELQEEVNRSLKISRTNTMTSTEFTTSATDRASKVLSFDSSGELAVTQELGEFQGDWAASRTYAVRDLVKDTSTNNIFICITAHTSSGSQPLTTNTDSAKWSLIVEAATATTSAATATTKAAEAATSATAAASSATSAASSATTATTKASEASTSATNAASSATASASSASGASTSATNAASSATAAAASAASASAAANVQVLSDTTPQLGGNLDTNEKEIVTVSNRDLLLAPNGTGAVEVKGNDNPGTIILNCESNSHGIKLQSPAHSANQSYTIKFPTNNITADKFLKVDSISGSGTTAVGQLSFADAVGSDISTLGQVFGNYKEVGSDATITTDNTRYQFLFGPISVTGSAVLTVGGDGALAILTFANLT